MSDTLQRVATLHFLSIASWTICVGCLLPAIVRLTCGRGRYFDPVWAIVFLLALNRLSFLMHLPRSLSSGSAAALALVMAVFSISYQRNDRRG